MEELSVNIIELCSQMLVIAPSIYFFMGIVASWLYVMISRGLSLFFSVTSALCLLIIPIPMALKCVGLVGSFSVYLFLFGFSIFEKIMDAHSHKHFMKTTSGLASFLQGNEYILVYKEKLKYSDVLNKPNDYLEKAHNWVQYVFPTDRKSKYNKNAPIISLEELALLRKDKQIIDNLQDAYKRMLDFYFVEDVKWVTKNNHNFKRITRIVRCLRLFGLDDEADTFLKMVREKVAHEEAVLGKAIVQPNTIEYWEKANQKVEVEPIVPWITRASRRTFTCPNCDEVFEEFRSVCPKCNQKMSLLYYTYKKDGLLRIL